jgi:hypothetical protein
MPFPKTEQELAEAGYEFENTGKCKGCGMEIAWYRTPRGRHISLNEGTLESHFNSCPKVQDFRR